MEKNESGKGMEKDRNSSYTLNNVVRERLAEKVTEMQRL